MLERLRALIGRDGVAYVSTPNVLTLAPEGEERSGNPWHVKEYRAEEFRALCERHFGSVELLGLFHARKLRAHQVAIERLGWDAIHAAAADHQAVLRPLHARDLRARLRAARRRPRPRAGLRRGPAAVSGRLSIVLHTHMPYVEGFGTWPFGEEWLWEAMATSYLPLLDVLDAHAGAGDAVADPGAVRPARGAGGGRALPRLPARAAARDAPARHRGGGGSRARARARALGRRSTRRPRSASRRAAATSSARSRRTPPGRPRPPTRCCRCWPPPAGVRLQLGAGIASHRRRFGHWDGGLWLPECAHAPWLDPLLEEAGRPRGLRRPHRRARPRRARAAAAAAQRRRARCSCRSTAR